jgi:hypothetical protein
LFEGQISLDDILNNELALVKELFEARQKLVIEKEEAKAKALENAQNTDHSYDYYDKM